MLNSLTRRTRVALDRRYCGTQISSRADRAV